MADTSGPGRRDTGGAASALATTHGRTDAAPRQRTDWAGEGKALLVNVYR